VAARQLGEQVFAEKTKQLQRLASVLEDLEGLPPRRVSMTVSHRGWMLIQVERRYILVAVVESRSIP
jgi:hypothetical protein